VAPSIDPELSRMTYMSSGACSAFWLCAAHAASPSGAPPTSRGGASIATSLTGGTSYVAKIEPASSWFPAPPPAPPASGAA
jgi:hypothetical protein